MAVALNLLLNLLERICRGILTGERVLEFVIPEWLQGDSKGDK